MPEYTVVKFFTPVFFACTMFGQSPSAQAPFSASPVALQEAFTHVEGGTNPVAVLLEEGRFEYDAAGRETYRYRMIFKVLNKTGAEGWATIERTWAPWQQERPSIRARVIAKDGTAHELDPKTIADAPVRNGDDDVLTDRRTVRAPLPAMEADAIVEEEIVTKQTLVPLDAGTVEYFYFGSSAPVARTTLRIQAPEKIPIRFNVRLLPNVTLSDRTEGGIREITFDQGPMKPLEDAPLLLPADEPRSPHVVFSTAPDWNTVARAYSEVVQKQLNGFDASRYLPKFPIGATREAKILAIVNFLNKDIRYTGIEFSEASLIPRKPSEVLEHQYGDCKDKSTLAVALLRSAGIKAYIALLDSSAGEDIEPDLPGLDVFNHAIVYVPGQPDFWLDPTDTNLRLGNISASNQGHYALIARPETTNLIRTPELTAKENRVVERREFQLSELGRAHVTETTDVFGLADRGYRGDFGDQDQKALHNSFKNYIEWTYGEAKIQSISTGAAADLTKPYRLRIELDDAQRGTTVRTEAAVGIRMSQLTTRLPEFFRGDPKYKTDESKPGPRPRTSDFSISEPYTYEWHYVIKAPPGFRVRQLPPPLEENLGPATLTAHFNVESPSTMLADFQFVMPKRRFSAAEGLALRDAVVELDKRKIVLVYFDQIGETDLASGKVKDALAEFSALRKLHPTEALHAMQTARALLAAGAGETARAEARRAVTLEPGSEKAYVQLAEILKNDLIGRPLEKGFDRDGAVAADRKALDLDPNDQETRANLAILLEHNPAGVRYGAGAKLDEGIVEYGKILDKLPGLGLPNNYPIALLRAGKIKELKAYLDKLPDDENTQALRISAEALLNGAAAALQQAGQVSGVDAKRRVLVSAAQTLLTVRQYDLAADIFAEAAAEASNPAATINLVDTLRRTRRQEQMAQTIREPEDAVRAFMIRVTAFEQHQSDWAEPISSFMMKDSGPDDAKVLARAITGARGKVRGTGLTPEAAIDIGLSAMQYSHEGSDESGWIVRTTAPGGTASAQQTWFVIPERQTYRILASAGQFAGVARLVLELVENGKAEQAKVWLDRVRREIPAGSGDDPLSGPMFSRMWQQGDASRPETIRTAAALLLCDKEREIGQTIAILEEAEKSASLAASDAISASLAEAYFTNKRYVQALTLSEALLRKLPKSASALRLALRAAYASGGEKEAGRIAGTYLDDFKDDTAALRNAAALALSFGDVERSTAIEKRIVDSGRGQAVDYNQLAWGALMAGKVSPETLELANRGVLLGGNESFGLMHTLAAVDAELDKPAEARAMLLQRITGSGVDDPEDGDWYVFGRIAESYGLTHEAAELYRRLERPKSELTIPSSSYALAQRRLKAIGELK
jgi:transglutaminase-like putative cysteine protease/tetratricopeptide (TPR) repeat protein